MSALRPTERLRQKLVALFVFMVVSLESWRVIPAFKMWGLDLHNLHAFQLCTQGGSPYDVDARACGDVLARPMIYPPLMYRSFAWLRALPLERAVYVWTGISLLAFAASLFAWVRFVPRDARVPRDHRLPLVTLGVLLLLQFPFVFALERGSTDAPAVVFWTLSAWLFERRKLTLAGLAAGLATSYKLYPAFACMVVGGALLVATIRKRGFTFADVARFGLGAVATFAVSNAIFSDARHYFFEVLPRFAKVVTEPHVYSHSIPSFVGADYPLFARLLTLILLGVWIWGAAAALPTKSPLAFAGALAMSTFGLGTSWDYNLTTAYPLLLLLFADGLRRDALALAALGIFALCGDRAWFTAKDAQFFTPQAHFALELAFIALAAFAMRETASPTEEAPPLTPDGAKSAA